MRTDRTHSSAASADAEAAALAELARGSARLRTLLLAPTVTLGALLTVPAYWVAREAQFALAGIAWIPVSAAAAAAPLVLGVFLGRHAARLALRARAPSLHRQLARRHGLSEEQVRELAAMVMD